MTEQPYFSVGQVAEKFRISPRIISTLFYTGKFRGDLCPVIAGRRMIPGFYLDDMERILRREGFLPLERGNR